MTANRADRPPGSTTLGIKVWKIIKRQGERGTSYRVRWSLDRREFSRTFKTKALADAFRAELLTAMRHGEAFDRASGRPVSSIEDEVPPVTWYEHAREYAAMKWKFAAAKSRVGVAETLTTAMPALLRTEPAAPQDLREALYGWAFNPGRKAKPPTEISSVLAWAARHSVLISDLNDPRILRKALDALSCKKDGLPAAAATYRRKRAVFNNALEYAVELGRLPNNPLMLVKRAVPRVPDAVDPGVLVDKARAEALFGAVGEQGEVGRRLVAFFACMYYAGLRPGEVTDLRRANLVLPPQGGGWGELRLSRTSPVAGTAWTNTGHRHDSRQLKHRAVGEVRTVPCHPRLVALLRAHLDEHGTTPDGRLFRGTRGGPISESVYGRVWANARRSALRPDEAASPMGSRPYDLRHACVTTWLNATGDPAQVAAWAGHSVNVLLRVYVRCVAGGAARAKEQIELALGTD